MADTVTAADRRRPASIVIALVAVVAIGAGLWIWLRPTPVAPGIVFVGDSVTYLSTKELARETRSEDPTVLARIGFRSDELLPLFQADVDRRARADGDDGLRQVAILVGYNDVLQDRVDGPALGRFLDQADRFDCAVWLTLPTVPMHDAQTARWNRRVRDEARKRSHVHVVDDWRDAVDEAEPGHLITRKDGVHPTAAGGDRLAQIYVDAVHRVC